MDELIERLAREAGVIIEAHDSWPTDELASAAALRFASLVAEECVNKVQAEVDHAAINGHWMDMNSQGCETAWNGKKVHVVRAEFIEASLASIRSKFAIPIVPFSAQEIIDAGKAGLDFYLANNPVDQITMERPLLKALQAKKKSAPGGKT